MRPEATIKGDVKMTKYPNLIESLKNIANSLDKEGQYKSAEVIDKAMRVIAERNSAVSKSVVGWGTPTDYSVTTWKIGDRVTTNGNCPIGDGIVGTITGRNSDGTVRVTFDNDPKWEKKIQNRHINPLAADSKSPEKPSQDQQAINTSPNWVNSQPWGEPVQG
jgi:hypothetical protein